MNWHALRAKISHPIVRLMLLIALQLSAPLSKRLPWLVFPRIVLYLWILSGLWFRPKTHAKECNPRFGLPWRLVTHLVGMILIMGIFYVRVSGSIAEGISPQPLQAIAATNEAEVLLGSDELTIYQESHIKIGTISYYTADGLAVAMAHTVTGLEPSRVSIGLSGPGYFDRQRAQVLANDDYGVVLKLDNLPDPERQKLVIAGPADIAVGEVAQLYSVRGGSFPVRIRGYRIREGVQFLVIQPIADKNKIIHGMSGSPIVQDGRLIGCVALVPAFPYFGLTSAHARLAADMYAASSQVITP